MRLYSDRISKEQESKKNIHSKTKKIYYFYMCRKLDLIVIIIFKYDLIPCFFFLGDGELHRTYSRSC